LAGSRPWPPLEPGPDATEVDVPGGVVNPDLADRDRLHHPEQATDVVAVGVRAEDVVDGLLPGVPADVFDDLVAVPVRLAAGDQTDPLAAGERVQLADHDGVAVAHVEHVDLEAHCASPVPGVVGADGGAAGGVTAGGCSRERKAFQAVRAYR